jgi:hypothetical protein
MEAEPIPEDLLSDGEADADDEDYINNSYPLQAHNRARTGTGRVELRRR